MADMGDGGGWAAVYDPPVEADGRFGELFARLLKAEGWRVVKLAPGGDAIQLRRRRWCVRRGSARSYVIVDEM